MTTYTAAAPERKRVTITSKRQFTIPQKFYSALGFDRDAICTLGDGFLIIEPVSRVTDGEYATQILAELIAEGYSGQELLAEFKTRQARIRPAVEAMLESARMVAEGKGEYLKYEDVFDTKKEEK